ncbi:hypothetical protein [Nocardia sp. NPDC051832]|uniref:hypothetical protein n=1 Tax=Nocardia sp. NPDC051832 TaxID=3155673 RepID=UPI0034490EEC
MVNVGDRVRLGPSGISIFEVLELDGAGHALVESVEKNVPGCYPFNMGVARLVVVERP